MGQIVHQVLSNNRSTNRVAVYKLGRMALWFQKTKRSYYKIERKLPRLFELKEMKMLSCGRCGAPTTSGYCHICKSMRRYLQNLWKKDS